MASWKKVIVSGSNAVLAEVTASTGFNGALSGNATTATTLETARNIGGVSFDGSSNINLPGVNTAGNQNTTGTAAGLTTARNIGGVSFDGTGDINLPGVNTSGNQDTSGNAATATALATSRNFEISGDGTAAAVGFTGAAGVNLSLTLKDGIVSSSAQLASDISGSLSNSAIAALGVGLVSSSGQVSDLAGVNNNSITITAGTGISFASGDGVFTLNQSSDETIADIAVDLNELGTETTIAQDDFIAMVDATDNGSGKITLSNLEDEIFGNVSGDATIAAGGALTIANNAVENSMLNSNVFGTTAGTALEGNTTVNDVSVANLRTALTGISDSTTIGDATDVTITTSGDLRVTGDLTVVGSRTELQVTNLNVEDQFITVNSGSGAADAGIVVEGQGAAFGWDESENRWAFDFAGATSDQTALGADAYAAAVVTTDDANYRKNGNIRVQSDEIYIYVE